MTDQQLHKRRMLLLKKSNAVLEIKGSLNGYNSDAYKKIASQQEDIDNEVERRGGEAALTKRQMAEILKK